MILIVALPLTNNGGRLAGYYMASVATLPLIAILSLIASNVAGHTKKTTVAALFLIAYCTGNIIGRYRPPPSRQMPSKVKLLNHISLPYRPTNLQRQRVPPFSLR